MLSIITSLYRSELHLSHFLTHVEKVHKKLEESNIPFEHIIIANDIIPEEENLLSSTALHFILHKVPRESVYASWNRGVRESKGLYISFWNVDDIRFYESFIEGKNTLNSGYDATYFSFIYKRYIEVFGIPVLIKRTVTNPQEYDAAIFRTTFPVGPFFMVKKNVFEKNGYFDETFKIAGDFDWWSRLACTDIKVKKTNTLGGIFTNNGKTLSGSKNTLHKEENRRIISKTIL